MIVVVRYILPYQKVKFLRNIVRNVHGQCVKAMQSGILSSRMKVKLLCNRLNRYTEVPGNDGCSARHLERRKGYVQYSEYSMVQIFLSPLIVVPQ